METTCTSGKRKKRRTRKCLDEIRKKSRRNCDDLNEVPVQKLKKPNKSVDNMKLIKKTRCTITTNRLTLRPTMFSKAVKSETITRPQLSSKQRADTSKSIIVPESPMQPEIIHCQESKDTAPRIPEKQRKSVAENTEHSNEIEEISFHDDSDSDRENTSQKSFIVFSPISQAIETEVVSGSPGEPPAPAAAAYRLYSEFMGEIADRITERAPDLIQPDVIWKTRKFLQDIYTDGCQRESEQNILQCMNINGASSDSENMEPPETIVQDPMEYIKLGMGRTRSVLRERNSSPPPSRALCPPARVPRSPSASPPSPPSKSSSTPHVSIINDTPEYTFYPRKLNQ